MVLRWRYGKRRKSYGDALEKAGVVSHPVHPDYFIFLATGPLPGEAGSMDSSTCINFIQSDGRDLFAAVSRLSQAPCCYHICQTYTVADALKFKSDFINLARMCVF